MNGPIKKAAVGAASQKPLIAKSTVNYVIHGNNLAKDLGMNLEEIIEKIAKSKNLVAKKCQVHLLCMSLKTMLRRGHR